LNLATYQKIIILSLNEGLFVTNLNFESQKTIFSTIKKLFFHSASSKNGEIILLLPTFKRVRNLKWRNVPDRIDLHLRFSPKVLNLLVSDTRQTEILASVSW